MNYEVKLLKLKIGKGVKIIDGGKTYEQINCREGLTLRVFRTASHGKYRGILFKELENTENDYKVFKRLTDRLAKASGEEIKNSKPDYFRYTSYTGLEQLLEGTNATIRINTKDTDYLPENVESFLDARSFMGGAVSNLLGYGALFAILASKGVSIEDYIAIPVFFTLAELISGMMGMMITMGSSGFRHDTWCGAIHALGFVPSRKIYRNKLKNPNYMLGRFLKTYTELEKIEKNVGSHKRKFIKLSKKLDKQFRWVEELFPYTPKQKGLSITHSDEDRKNVLNLLSYTLRG